MWKAILLLIAVLVMSLGPFFMGHSGGYSISNPGDYAKPPLTPAPYTFAIWYLIYIWLTASAVYGVFQRASAPSWDAFRLPLLGSLIAGAFWGEVVQQSHLWGTVLIWIMLIFALIAMFRAPRADAFWARYPIGLYAGWLSAAAVVSTATFLTLTTSINPMTSSILLLLAALVIVLVVIQRLPVSTPTYGAAVAWALIGVIVYNAQHSNWIMIALCSVGILLVGVMTMVSQNTKAGRIANA